ncbi:peptidase inhibitor family I36 protein [Lentzea rhizosphaerae]|jgi:hypothetical protein|uniref:Peptidase inhibitor family I36 protein n=1 Tax=Lentzea rhizosphaerae TaxID=2041025 RepID=A0ABV8BV34_9PSEU
MRKTLSVLFAAVMVLLTLAGTAAADPDALTIPAIEAPVVQEDVSALALTCPSGDLCVWPNNDGSSSRCSWTNRDADWWNAPVTCSWASSRAVMRVYNNGASSSYDRVCLYTGANYTGSAWYIRQRVLSGTAFPGVRIRSHRWVAGAGGTTC